MASGRVRVAGVDEVGRGPLAGPVTAAAVILDPARIPDGLNDSKQLSAKRRLALAEILAEGALTGVGHASVAEIEQHNILRASHLAMRRAIAALSDRSAGISDQPTIDLAWVGPCRTIQRRVKGARP